jgi:hypothetical protein
VGTILAAVVTAVGGYGEGTTAGRREAGILPVAVKIGLPAFVILLALLLVRFANPVLAFAGTVPPGPTDTYNDVVTNTCFRPLLAIGWIRP